MRPFQHSAPRTLEDAITACDATVADLMSAGDPLVPTGTVPRGAGNDLMDLMKEGLFSPAHMVDVRSIPELQGVSENEDGSLRIGAAVTIAAMERDERFRSGPWRAVGEAALHIAHPQIRATATMAGSLLQRPRCWYFRLEEASDPKRGDDAYLAYEGRNEFHAIFDNAVCPHVHPSTLATPFLALDASIELAGRDGRRTLPVADFFVSPSRIDDVGENVLRPGEIVTAVTLPAPQKAGGGDLVSFHIKQGQRESYDWAIVDVAVATRRGPDGSLSHTRIALGSVAPTPRRSRDAERLLDQLGVGPDAIRGAARLAIEGATPLSRNAYKVPMLETVVRRTIEGALA